MKVLVALVALVLLLWLWRRPRRTRDAAGPPPDADGGRARSTPVPMLRCATCGVHVAATEAVRAHGEAFCCDEHRDRRPGRGG